MGGLVLGGLILHSFVYYCRLTWPGILRVFSLDFPWLGKCCTLSSYVYIFTLDFPWLDLSGVFSLSQQGCPYNCTESGGVYI
jgi:hypothetical protein